MPSLPPGVERYRVRGGGSVAINIFAGDEVVVTDLEGLQSCDLLAMDGGGRCDAGILGAKANICGDAVHNLLTRARAALKGRAPELTFGEAIRVFGDGSRAGEQARFAIARDGILIVGAPGGIMDAERQDTATEIELRVKRSVVRRNASDNPLPDPLAEPLQDIRIARSTAKAYAVRAGEYIQVIDVAGRQCTDFQCFSARKLDKGIENALDATVTRTLTSRLYPIPGLPSKAFGRDFEPLIELVRDMVGRHDAFATACNSRYYDDAGYPGHVNCTENFNQALAPYGVARRKGWEAPTRPGTPG